MSLDGKILSRAIVRHSARRRSREDALQKKRESIYRQIPRLEQIDKSLTLTLIDAAIAALSEDAATAISRAESNNLALQREHSLLLTSAGYAADFLDEKPFCDICADRGFLGSKPCSCLLDLYKDEQIKELSLLLKLSENTFDSFDLNYYDNTTAPNGISPRETMELVYETCLQYANKFSRNSSNLFLTGGPGLGKTFLSTCIARVISENGYSVVYDTAIGFFSKLENEKFLKHSFTDELRADVDRCFSCDLLILDDLGTEMTTAFTVSALYDILNSRLVSKKQTIINSNLSISEIRKRYSPQIASRLQGEYQKLSFSGSDIRILKQE